MTTEPKRLDAQRKSYAITRTLQEQHVKSEADMASKIRKALGDPRLVATLPSNALRATASQK